MLFSAIVMIAFTMSANAQDKGSSECIAAGNAAAGVILKSINQIDAALIQIVADRVKNSTIEACEKEKARVEDLKKQENTLSRN